MKSYVFPLLSVFLTILFVPVDSIYAQTTAWEENQLDGNLREFYIGGFSKNTIEFADIDGDGDLDCFVSIKTGSFHGNLAFFENTGDSISSEWKLVTMKYLENDVFTSFGLKARFVDIDSDGDLDMFIGGGMNPPPLLYFRNTGSVYNAEWEQVPGFLNDLEEDKIMKYCYPSFVDIDGDDDLDLIYGNYYSDDIYYENVGDKYNCDFIKKQGEYFGQNNYGNCHNLEFFDIDGDSDFDALIGTHYYLIYMENTGSDDSAVWQAVTTNYLESDNVGTFLSPSFADIDHNGASELYVGTEDGRTWNYNNALTKWELYYGLYFDEGYYINPEFADLNGDEKKELIVPGYDIGHDSSFIRIYANTGNADSIVWHISGLTIQVEFPYPVNRVTFADIDADGDLDLIAGFRDFNKDIVLYKNTGDIYTPIFLEEYDVIATFQEEELVDFFPLPVDYDNDHDLDLIVSAQDGTTNSWEWVDFFENKGDSTSCTWEYSYTQRLGYGAICCFDDDMDGDIDLMFSFLNHITLVQNIGTKWEPIFQAPHIEKIEIPDQYLWGIALTDLNNDGKDDLVIGTENGGMYRYDNMGIIYNVNPMDKEAVTIYPNPALNDLYISGIDFKPGNYRLCLYNSSGSKLEDIILSKTHISVSGYAPGVYLYRIFRKDKSIKTGKLIIR